MQIIDNLIHVASAFEVDSREIFFAPSSSTFLHKSSRMEKVSTAKHE